MNHRALTIEERNLVVAILDDVKEARTRVTRAPLPCMNLMENEDWERLDMILRKLETYDPELLPPP